MLTSQRHTSCTTYNGVISWAGYLTLNSMKKMCSIQTYGKQRHTMNWRILALKILDIMIGNGRSGWVNLRNASPELKKSIQHNNTLQLIQDSDWKLLTGYSKCCMIENWTNISVLRYSVWIWPSSFTGHLFSFPPSSNEEFWDDMVIWAEEMVDCDGLIGIYLNICCSFTKTIMRESVDFLIDMINESENRYEVNMLMSMLCHNVAFFASEWGKTVSIHTTEIRLRTFRGLWIQI